MKENFTDEELYLYINDLLSEGEDVFAEFNVNPLDSMSCTQFLEMQTFANSSLNLDIYNSLVYSIASLTTIKVLLDRYNENLNVFVDINEVTTFVDFRQAIIDNAKSLLLYYNKIGRYEDLDLKTLLLYSFAHTNYCLNNSCQNKKMQRLLNKEIIKPIIKCFKSEYKYILATKQL